MKISTSSTYDWRVNQTSPLIRLFNEHLQCTLHSTGCSGTPCDPPSYHVPGPRGHNKKPLSKSARWRLYSFFATRKNQHNCHAMCHLHRIVRPPYGSSIMATPRNMNAPPSSSSWSLPHVLLHKCYARNSESLGSKKPFSFYFRVSACLFSSRKRPPLHTFC